MTRKSNPALIGAFVLAGLALGFGILALLATDQLFTHTEKYVMVFEGNVDGLDVGSPVLYKGFRVGRVTDMRLMVDRETGEATLPVFVALEPDRLDYVDGGGVDPPGADFHIERGLRAQLQRKSLITGQMVIMLVEAPDTRVVMRSRGNGLPEIPTIPTLTQDLADTLRSLPLERMITDTHASLEAVRALLESGQIRETLSSLDATLDRADRILAELEEPLPALLRDLSTNSEELSATLAEARKLSAELTPAAAELRKRLPDLLDDWTETFATLDAAGKEMEATLENLRGQVEPGSLVHRELTDTLDGIQDATEAVERLADYLQRHPEALLRGKPQPRNLP